MSNKDFFVKVEEEKAPSEIKKAQLFYEIFNVLREGLLLWEDKHYTIIDMNPAGEKITGLKKEEICNKSLKMLFQKMNQRKKNLDKEFKLNSTESEGILTLQVEPNNEINIEYTTKKHIYENINLTIFRDITDKVQLFKKVQKTDTLSLVGQLAAGIAHEIRNPLTALKGFIQLLENSDKEENYFYYDVIKTELDRIDSIINELLLLVKPKNLSFSMKNVVKLMEETIELMKPQGLLHNIQFIVEKNGKIPEIYCEPNQLKKVFINLIKNAIEVMPKGGFITINFQKRNEKEICISIKDEGTGIPEEQLKKLGEPFFTTKEKGTGLGLMVSYQIIEEHHGKIEVQSAVGEGTNFQIYLPIHQEKN